jgi:hypothetical protein
MSALTYFLNAGLKTEASSYGLKCLSLIDQAIEKGKKQTKLPPIAEFQLDALDALEAYYFNEKRIGIIIEDLSKNQLNTPLNVSFLYLDDPPDEVLENPDYEENLIIWFKSIRKIKSDLDSLDEDEEYFLRRPRDWKSIDLETELYLADEISEQIEERLKLKLIRSPSKRWLVKRL